MTDSLEPLASRFFATVGVAEPAGYRAIEVLLDDSVQPYFGGHEHLLLAFSPEAAHEHARAELLTYGSPLLDVMAEVAMARGNSACFYLGSLGPTMGRTLEKAKAQARIPGHILEIGEEQLLLFHHALFRFKISLVGEDREEIFGDVIVDLHTGWSTLQLEERDLWLYGSKQVIVGRELRLKLSLQQAYQVATERVRENMGPRIKEHEERLKIARQAEQKQVEEYYQTMIAKLEEGKARKGADPKRIDSKIQSTLWDQELRVKDLEKRYQFNLELTPVQLALVSYRKAAVPLRLLQGKETRSGIAIWDSLAREGYFSFL